MREKLIEKLFQGKCTRFELQLLFDLINADKEPPSQKLLEKLWEESGKISAVGSSARDDVFTKVFGQITQEKDGGQKPEKIPARRINWLLWRKHIAAGFLILLIGLGSFYVLSSQPKDVVQTTFGERRSIQFEDGSTMRLNANSRVSYSDGWQDGEPRQVELMGEAYFNVEKKPSTNQVFNVRTNHAIVEVLGTTFNVHSTSDETRVYLEEGSIRLQLIDLDSMILMQPGDFVIYREQDRSVVVERDQPRKYHTSWKDGVLIFYNSPLSDVLNKIEQIYGVQFTMDNEENFERLIAFPLPIDSLETALSILEKTLVDLKINQNGNRVLIKQSD